MKRLMVLALLLVVAMASLPGPAEAGGSEDAALALGAFAVFNQLIRGDTILHDLFGGPRPRVVVQPAPPIVYAPPPIVYAPPRPIVYAPPPIFYAPPRPVVYAPARAFVFAPPRAHIARSRAVVVAPPGYKVYSPKHGPVVVAPRGHKGHPVKHQPRSGRYHHGR
jgi:hypothetical protein